VGAQDKTIAISTFMLLFTSSSTTIQYLLLGHLRFDYALWFGAWTLVAVSQRCAVPCSVVRLFERADCLAVLVLISGSDRGAVRACERPAQVGAALRAGRRHLCQRGPHAAAKRLAAGVGELHPSQGSSIDLCLRALLAGCVQLSSQSGDPMAASAAPSQDQSSGSAGAGSLSQHLTQTAWQSLARLCGQVNV
jgi:hypothetical protein